MTRKMQWTLLTVAAAISWAMIWGGIGLSQDGAVTGGKSGEASLQQKVRRLKDECVGIQRKLDGGEEEQTELRRRMRTRLTALYKFRTLGYASTLFPVHDLQSFMEAGYCMLQIERADRELNLRWHEASLRQRHLGALVVQRQMELRALEGQMASVGGSDDSVGRVGQAPALPATGIPTPLEKLEPSGTALLKKIPFRKPIFSESAERFPALRGTLSPPTVGELVLTYGSKGDKRAETFLHGDGVTFVAPKGQPVEAIFDGVVVFSDWLKEYGNVMIIDHGDHYHSLVAHAERLLKRVGDPVKGGEVVATVGNTGSSNITQLYFEIRHHGKPVNPMEWLASGK
jgi:murein hydrolase activator